MIFGECGGGISPKGMTELMCKAQRMAVGTGTNTEGGEEDISLYAGWGLFGNSIELTQQKERVCGRNLSLEVKEQKEGAE